MFRPRRTKRPQLDTGQVYRRDRANNVVELAKVSAVWADSAGIQHVEFDLDIRQHDRGTTDHRTLSIDSFVETYPVAVNAD